MTDASFHPSVRPSARPLATKKGHPNSGEQKGERRIDSKTTDPRNGKKGRGSVFLGRRKIKRYVWC